MKVLFVSSGNSSSFEIAPFIKAQGEDLKKIGVQVDFYPIKGKGILGYLKNIPKLRKKIKSSEYDIVHAHFVLSAWVALLSFSGKRIIASFMGSDTYGDVDINGNLKFSSYFNIFLAKLIQPFLSKIIVKSKNLEEYIYLKSKCVILPNGVNIDKFKILNFDKTRKSLGLKLKKKYVLFLGNKEDPRKNYRLAKDSFELLKDNNIELLTPYPISHGEIVKYMNASDCLVFTSYLEGSPNIVKEAMACNLPIVSVDVGDTSWLLEKIDMSYIVERDEHRISEKIKYVLDLDKRSDGRAILKELKLTSDDVAHKLEEIYKNVIN